MRSFAILLGLLFLATSAHAYSSNPPNGYAGDPPNYNSCVNCHSSYPLNSGDGYVTISGLPTDGYVSGTTYQLTAEVADPGQSRWGFELTPIYQSGGNYLQAGTLVVTDPGHTQLGTGSGSQPDYLKQNSTGTFSGTPGPTTWSFSWTAPDPSIGTLTFYIAGIACNGGGTSGDYVYTASFPVDPAGSIPNFIVNLTYQSGSPVPASGGNLTFDVYLENASGSPQNFDAWLASSYAGGNPTTLVLRSFTNYQSGWAVNRPGTFFPVPGGWAAGNYTMYARCGDEPSVVWAEDSFPFTKSGVSDGIAFQPWPVDGAPNPFGDDIGNVVSHPETPILANAYPNPFNPSTVIDFQLPEAGMVSLAVYDLSGRLVSELVNGWRDAAMHEVTFDASGLPSGVYIYHLQAGSEVLTGKMVLMK